MPGPSETLPVLEQRLTERLLAFELLDEVWPRGRTAIERAEMGRERAENSPPTFTILNSRETLQARFRQRRPPLAAGADEVWKVEEPRPHALLAPPDMRGLGVSFLAVIEREGAPVELAPASAKAFLVH